MLMKLLSLFFIFNATLSAQIFYIHLAETDKKDEVLTIIKEFKVIELKLAGEKVDTKYIVFSGPFKDIEEAKNALKFLKEYYPDARLMSKVEAKLYIYHKRYPLTE